jgi:acyl-CoA dehydrogenase
MPDDAGSHGQRSAARALEDAAEPRAFSLAMPVDPDDRYLREPAIRKLVEFFEDKTVAALKTEDRREQWYEDWLAYQGEHGLYASVLSPARFSASGAVFDLLRYARFLEVFAYCSPGHGYSVQVTSLGLFAILMGANDTLKREAVTAVEKGGVLAFGVSEKAHGSDLLASEFTLTETGPDRFVANGTKYYIGNSNVAAIIAVLARRTDTRPADRAKRASLAFFALRPGRAAGFRHAPKIRTLGVRAGHVGEFEVRDHELPRSDVIAEGRRALDAVRGSVTLGKFFLGFGSIGICEHALVEASEHLGARVLYGKPVLAMPHIRSAMVEAYARIAAMKLFAYRALDYVHAASAKDRRYLLFCAVQKARVSTEGVKAMALLSECVGARGFEADTYFEMALRDIQLIPSLESSAHINLGLAARFSPRYFGRSDPRLGEPDARLADDAAPIENEYLMAARTGAVGAVAFPSCLDAYRPLGSVRNVRGFVRQVKRFRVFLLAQRARRADSADMRYALALGQCVATVAYAQLIAENARRLHVAPEMISVIFHLLILDIGGVAMTLASLPQFDGARRSLLRRMVTIPRASQSDWDFVAARIDAP